MDVAKYRFSRRTLEEHKGNWSTQRHQRSCPSAVAKSPQAELAHIDVALVALTTDEQLTTYNVDGSEPPLDIVAGPDGNLWYNDGGGNIYQLTTSGHSTRVRNVYEMGGLWSAYGHLWYWTASGFDLVEMSTDGSIAKTYPVTADCLPGSLTGGPQHSIWFVDGNNLCVARMTLSGKFRIVPMYSQKYSSSAHPGRRRRAEGLPLVQ